jgi:hypothetical protein
VKSGVHAAVATLRKPRRPTWRPGRRPPSAGVAVAMSARTGKRLRPRCFNCDWLLTVFGFNGPQLWLGVCGRGEVASASGGARGGAARWRSKPLDPPFGAMVRAMAVPGGPWRSMGRSMAVHGAVPGGSWWGPWRSLAVRGGPWRSLAVPGGPWRSLAVPGGPWRSLAVPGAVPGGPWCGPWRSMGRSMAVHGAVPSGPWSALL